MSTNVQNQWPGQQRFRISDQALLEQTVIPHCEASGDVRNYDVPLDWKSFPTICKQMYTALESKARYVYVAAFGYRRELRLEELTTDLLLQCAISRKLFLCDKTHDSILVGKISILYVVSSVAACNSSPRIPSREEPSAIFTSSGT